jgi:hypothetical protein
VPDAGSSFLPVTGADSTAGLAPVSNDIGSAFGLDAGAGTNTVPFGGAASIDPAAPTTDYSIFTGDEPTVAPNPLPDETIAPQPNSPVSQAWDWIKSNPKLAASLGLGAESLFTALSPPKLPGSARTALDASSAAVQQAQGVISSGGTSSPAWAQQKSSIDQQVDQNLQQAIEQATQAAATNGEGGANSGVVQQQVNQLRQQAETQRQQLYAQALQTIVSDAVTEMTGGNQTLSSIAQMQLTASQEARASAGQTASLAALLGFS